MANQIISAKDYLLQRQDQMRADIPPSGGRNISIKGRVFTLPDSTSHTGPLAAIILGFRLVNQLFPGVYNPKNPSPPICAAVGHARNMRPLDSSPQKQHESCSDEAGNPTCVHNQWGSASNGNGKNCKNSARIGLVAPDSNEILLLDAAKSNLGVFFKYLRQLDAEGLIPEQVITSISFKPDLAHPALEFKKHQTHDRFEEIIGLAQSEQLIKMLEAPPSFEKFTT